MGRTPTGVKSKNGQWLPVKLKDKIREGPVVSHCFFYYYFENWSRTLLFAYIRLRISSNGDAGHGQVSSYSIPSIPSTSGC